MGTPAPEPPAPDATATEPDTTAPDHPGRTRGSGPTQGALAITAAVLLGLAAVLTAWSAYRESLTTDLVLRNYQEMQALIALANDKYSLRDQQESLEVEVFLSWSVAEAAGNEPAMVALERVMSDELIAAMDWWVEQPDETRPPTPFTEINPAYADLPSAALIADGDAYMAEAETARLAAEEADAVSDRFDLAQVFFAVVLFVAGLTTIVQRRSIQVGFLALSVAGLLGGVAILVTSAGWYQVG